MKIKTNKLEGAALNYAVAKCEGIRVYIRPYEHTLTGVCILDADLVDMGTDGSQELRYSRDWSQGGPIIGREKIQINPSISSSDWGACNPSKGHCVWVWADAPLIAAMRCYVESKLGKVVEIPNDLIEKINDQN
jgi:hypothetical protein